MVERIAGRVLHRGVPQAGCRVLAVNDAVLADAETGADGGWELEAERAVVVFARCRGEALGVVSRPAVPGGEPIDLEITSVAPTHELTIRLEGDAMPEWVRPQVQLTPMRIDDVDLRWVHAPVRQMSGGPLARITPDGREFSRFAQAGTWWCAAHFEQVPDARAEGMEDVRWEAIAARTDAGAQLPLVRRGFQLEIDGPIAVTITLAPA